MKKILFLFLNITLVACATPYQPSGFRGGFSEAKIDFNVFMVEFNGNGYIRSGRVRNYALLRSAEVALEHGFKYFAIIDGQQYSSTFSHTVPQTSRTTGTVYNGQISARTTTSGGQTYIISKPSASNTIICFIQKPPGFAYNAELLAKGLKQKYEIEDAE